MEVQLHHINNRTYQEVWDFQTILHNDIKDQKRSRDYQENLIKGKSKIINHLVFCEHKHVLTLGKSAKEGHLVTSQSDLDARDIELFKINRGGDITYHGPGQLTGYLIFDLEELYRDVHRFVRNIEECIIRLLTKYDLEGHRIKDYTGVWLIDGEKKRKICAIGVHLSRWVSMHGFALNLNTDLSYFNNIIPCGIQEEDKTVTSLSKELSRPIDFELIKNVLLEIMEEVFSFKTLKY